MENNFDIHKWQAEYLRENVSKKQVNEQAEAKPVAVEVLQHVKEALQLIEQYKEAENIFSPENELNEVEGALESVVEMLEDIIR